MIACLRERGGTPAELLDDADFIDFMLPLLRADFHLCGTHPARMATHTMARAGTSAGGAALDCPIDVFVGRDDPATANSTDVDAWAQQTRGPCEVHWFDGGHFSSTRRATPYSQRSPSRSRNECKKRNEHINRKPAQDAAVRQHHDATVAPGPRVTRSRETLATNTRSIGATRIRTE